MSEDNGDQVMAEPKGISKDKWLMYVVGVCIMTAASWGVLGVKASAEKGIADAAQVKDDVAELRMRLAVAESQRTSTSEEYNRRFSELSGQLTELNRKMDWIIRRVGGGKDQQ